jgi:hypothetical protein
VLFTLEEELKVYANKDQRALGVGGGESMIADAITGVRVGAGMGVGMDGCGCVGESSHL